MKYIVVYMECGDLNVKKFRTEEKARKFLEQLVWKSKLIIVQGKVKVEDHT